MAGNKSASAVRSSDVLYNGAGTIIVHASNLLDLVTAVTAQNALLIPFAATLKEVRSRVRTACGTAAGLAQLKGVEKGGTAYAQQSHATTDAAGTDFVWTLTDAVIPEGEVLYWAGDGGATATGDVDCVAIIVPREG